MFSIDNILATRMSSDITVRSKPVNGVKRSYGDAMACDSIAVRDDLEDELVLAKRKQLSPPLTKVHTNHFVEREKTLLKSVPRSIADDLERKVVSPRSSTPPTTSGALWQSSMLQKLASQAASHCYTCASATTAPAAVAPANHHQHPHQHGHHPRERGPSPDIAAAAIPPSLYPSLLHPHFPGR